MIVDDIVIGHGAEHLALSHEHLTLLFGGIGGVHAVLDDEIVVKHHLVGTVIGHVVATVDERAVHVLEIEIVGAGELVVVEIGRRAEIVTKEKEQLLGLIV